MYIQGMGVLKKMWQILYWLYKTMFWRIVIFCLCTRPSHTSIQFSLSFHIFVLNFFTCEPWSRVITLQSAIYNRSNSWIEYFYDKKLCNFFSFAIFLFLLVNCSLLFNEDIKLRFYTKFEEKKHYFFSFQTRGKQLFELALEDNNKI